MCKSRSGAHWLERCTHEKLSWLRIFPSRNYTEQQVGVTWPRSERCFSLHISQSCNRRTSDLYLLLSFCIQWIEKQKIQLWLFLSLWLREELADGGQWVWKGTAVITRIKPPFLVEKDADRGSFRADEPGADSNRYFLELEAKTCVTEMPYPLWATAMNQRSRAKRKMQTEKNTRLHFEIYKGKKGRIWGSSLLSICVNLRQRKKQQCVLFLFSSKSSASYCKSRLVLTQSPKAMSLGCIFPVDHFTP